MYMKDTVSTEENITTEAGGTVENTEMAQAAEKTVENVETDKPVEAVADAGETAEPTTVSKERKFNKLKINSIDWVTRKSVNTEGNKAGDSSTHKSMIVLFLNVTITDKDDKSYKDILALPADFALTITDMSRAYQLPEQTRKIVPMYIEKFEGVLTVLLQMAVERGCITAREYVDFCKKRWEQYEVMRAKGRRYRNTRTMLDDFYAYYFPHNKAKFGSFNELENANRATIEAGLPYTEVLGRTRYDFYTDDQDRVRRIPRQETRREYALKDKIVHALELIYELDGELPVKEFVVDNRVPAGFEKKAKAEAVAGETEKNGAEAVAGEVEKTAGAEESGAKTGTETEDNTN